MIASNASPTDCLTPTAVRELLGRQTAFLRLTVHELRGPLAVVNGYLELARDGSLGPLPQSPAIREALDMMAASVQAMEALVAGLAAVARQDDSGEPLRRRPSQLGRVVADAVAAVGLQAQSRQVRIEQRGVEVDAEVDPDLLGVALRNLLNNAVQHSSTASAVEIMVDAVESTATITVSDDGPGISPADAERIFEPWHRIGRSDGLGLGLWIVRRIAEWHGGHVTVHSEPGCGATFAVVIPWSMIGEDAAQHRRQWDST